MRFNRLLKQFLPRSVVASLQTIRSLPRRHAVRNLRSVHDSWRRGADPHEVFFDKDVHFRVVEPAREAMEHFAFRSIETVAEMRNFLRLSRGHRVLLDIGALHGAFSLAFCAMNMSGSALAFEPSREARDLLGENITLNNLSDRVSVIAAAAGAGPGVTKMVSEWHHLRAVEASEEMSRAIDVPVIAIDEVVSSRSVSPDVFKIDVEGYEYEVLLGAVRTLEAHRPKVFLELHPWLLAARGIGGNRVLQVLIELGYHFRSSTGKLLSTDLLLRQSSLASWTEPIRLVALHQDKEEA